MDRKMPTRRRAILSPLMFAALCVAASAEQPASTFTGSWTATAGTLVLHGTWSAVSSPRTPDVASGSWLLTNASGGVVMEGTWSARKAPGPWRGTWSARARNGREFRGTWDAQLDAGTHTFADLLQRTLGGQVGGGWRAGAASGGWILKSGPQRRRP